MEKRKIENGFHRKKLFLRKNLEISMTEKRYRDYPSFFKTLFQERVQKLSIDGGFTCPNRDGSKGKGGCTFCNNESFNPDYCRAVKGITCQIEEGIRFLIINIKVRNTWLIFRLIPIPMRRWQC